MILTITVFTLKRSANK